MKRLLTITLITVCLYSPLNSFAQATEIEQLVLNVEKLQQLENILDQMYTGYKILTKGYNTIKDIAEGNFSLHQVFLDGLYAVNPTVRNYKRIPYIIQYQGFLNKEYKRAFNQFRNDPNLTVREIKYIENIYGYLIKQSLSNLEELLMIVTATRLRMSDEERLHAIDRLYYSMENKVVFLKLFNQNTQLLALQRASHAGNINKVRKLYNINP